MVLLFREAVALRLSLQQTASPSFTAVAGCCGCWAGPAGPPWGERRTAVNPQTGETALLPPQLVPSHLGRLFSSLGGSPAVVHFAHTSRSVKLCCERNYFQLIHRRHSRCYLRPVLAQYSEAYSWPAWNCSEARPATSGQSRWHRKPACVLRVFRSISLQFGITSETDSVSFPKDILDSLYLFLH